MSESLNRKRKANSVPGLGASEQQQLEQTIQPPVSEENTTHPGSSALPPVTSSLSKSLPKFSSSPKLSKLPVMVGLASGVLGGVLAALAVLTTPYLNSYLLGLNAPSRQSSILSEKTTAERMASLEAKLAAINASGADVSKTDMTVSSLLSRTEALEKTLSESPTFNSDSATRLSRLETSFNTYLKQQSGYSGTALIAATDALKRKFARGSGFLPELRAIESWVDPNFNLNALKQHADAGLPTVQRISQRFAEIGPDIIKDSSPPADGLLGRVGQAASGLVKVRPSTEPYAIDASSVVSRVQASLARNEIGPALDDLAKLGEPALSKAGPVIKDLKARLDVEAAIRALEQSALQSLDLKKN